MKKNLLPAVFLITQIAVAIFLMAASQKESIRWRWHDIPVIGDPEHKGERLQFGLRGDGVVVWREILNSTNSPAEAPELSATNSIWFNSIQMTNFSWGAYTNTNTFYPFNQ